MGIHLKNTMPNWKKTFLTIWAGQAVSMLTSSVLQMSIVWYLTILLAGISALLPSFRLLITDDYRPEKNMEK